MQAFLNSNDKRDSFGYKVQEDINILSSLDTLEVKEANPNDGFIKKTCEFIEQNITGYIDVTHKGGDENITLQERFIDEFKKYMIEGD